MRSVVRPRRSQKLMYPYRSALLRVALDPPSGVGERRVGERGRVGQAQPQTGIDCSLEIHQTTFITKLAQCPAPDGESLQRIAIHVTSIDIKPSAR
jgi:hypothetical protein